MLMQNPSFFTLDTNHYITFMYGDIKNITFEDQFLKGDYLYFLLKLTSKY
ncbi:hypothetical protein BCAH1134_2451 [Bacillus cereus AH1134]|nr:hypothetical protein BCAH1134_2451 [Bacillus cereus AH1134]